MNAPDKQHHFGTRELGRFDAPVLVCGGAYSNLEALEALFAKADELAIPASHIIHTGDAVAYCANPAETAELLRISNVHAIQGNVEESLAASLPDCGCGFGEGSQCERLSAEWFGHADARIDDELRRWMGKLPHHLTFELAGKRAHVVHGSVSAVNRFMFASLPADDFAAEFALCDADIVIAGHSGIPFTRRLGARLWHNSGSLGMPANDGTPRAWFSVLTPGRNAIHIAHHALEYDHEKARAGMMETGVAREYAQALVTGLWPSLDILPETERHASGQPLDLSEPFFWEPEIAVSAR